MKILVIGSGGREHALVWKIAQSPMVEKIYCAPGNPGIAEIAEVVQINVNDSEKLLSFAVKNSIDLTVIGPEDPLVNGLSDQFESAGLVVFGPRASAARLEGSKAFAKELMSRYNIPTAEYKVYTSYQQAQKYLQSLEKYPVVLKASGLAAGKGVLICPDHDTTRQALADIMDRKLFGSAGDEVVIEEFLDGEEVSIFVLTDGKDYKLLSSSQDHKKVFDGDEGKNTGGMGAYAPAPIAGDQLLAQIEEIIIRPTLQAIREQATSYRGVLYFGLIIGDSGPKVLEYNCRFGDPETEVVLPLLESDLVPLLLACCQENLADHEVALAPGYAVDVVLASGGYPDAYQKNYKITGLESLPDDILVFHAGTKRTDTDLVTNGGRVLNIVAKGEDFEAVRAYLYQYISRISFSNMHYRKDIGFRAQRHMQNMS